MDATTTSEKPAGYSLGEINALNSVLPLEKIDLKGFATFDRTFKAILRGEHPELLVWVREAIIHEIKVRQSNGSLERGVCALSYRFSTPTIIALAAAMNFLRDDPAQSDEVREWCRSVHELTFVILASRAKINTDGDRLLGLKEVVEKLGLTREELWKMVNTKAIPQPIKIGPRNYRWHAGDLLIAMSNMPRRGQ